MNSWYVVQSKPHKEDDVATLLRKAGVEVFLPRVRSVKAATVPLFPLYLFTYSDFEDIDNHRLVKFTRGVNKILGSNGKPVPIPTKAIEIIKARVNSDQIIEYDRLIVGRSVRVKKGPFRDLEGILERPVSSAGRVAVLLSIYGKSIRMIAKAKDIAVI